MRTDPDQLLKNADMALYRAKTDGRGTYRFFEPGNGCAHAGAPRAGTRSAQGALVDGEFELYYQPLINLEKDEVMRVRSAAALESSQRGLVPPLEFIPLAEETGLIVPIGEWVLRQACQEAAKWPSHIKVAVNVSSVQFKVRNLTQVVMARAGAVGSGAAPARTGDHRVGAAVQQRNDARDAA